jgi:biopolymer transport protein ExbD
MIDVMFFLLATFMLASLSMQRLDSIKIDLPGGQAQRLNLDTPLTLTVTRANAIFVNRQPVPPTPRRTAWLSRRCSKHGKPACSTS